MLAREKAALDFQFKLECEVRLEKEARHRDLRLTTRAKRAFPIPSGWRTQKPGHVVSAAEKRADTPLRRESQMPGPCITTTYAPSTLNVSGRDARRVRQQHIRMLSILMGRGHA